MRSRTREGIVATLLPLLVLTVDSMAGLGLEPALRGTLGAALVAGLGWTADGLQRRIPRREKG